jgi:hypothetical protein
MKVPPAKELNIISIILFVAERARPRAIPKGVASAKKRTKKWAFCY